MKNFKFHVAVSLALMVIPRFAFTQSGVMSVEFEANSEAEISAQMEQKIKELEAQGFEIVDSESHKIVVSEAKVESGVKKEVSQKGTGKFKKVQVQRFQINVGKGVKHASAKKKAKGVRNHSFAQACGKLVPKIQIKLPKFVRSEIKETVVTEVPYETNIPAVEKYVASVSYDKPEVKKKIYVKEEASPGSSLPGNVNHPSGHSGKGSPAKGSGSGPIASGGKKLYKLGEEGPDGKVSYRLVSKEVYDKAISEGAIKN